MSSYWERRYTLLYYFAVFQVVSAVGRNARSILDVGSGNTDYIKWFGWIDRKVQLNLKFNNELAGVERIEADFLNWNVTEFFDVTICLQVLEHVEEAEKFCDKLKETSSNLVISVPYKWRAGNSKSHVHDPVDKDKLRSWMKLKPNHSLVVAEPFGSRRLIAYYDLEGGSKKNIPREEARQAITEKASYLYNPGHLK